MCTEQKIVISWIFYQYKAMIKQIAIDPSCSKIVATYIDLKLFQIFNAVETKEEMEIPTKCTFIILYLFQPK